MDGKGAFIDKAGHGDPYECEIVKEHSPSWNEQSHEMGLGTLMAWIFGSIGVLMVIMILAVVFAYCVHRFYSNDWVGYAKQKVNEVSNKIDREEEAAADRELDELGDVGHYTQDHRIAQDIDAMDPSQLNDEEIDIMGNDMDDEVTIHEL